MKRLFAGLVGGAAVALVAVSALSGLGVRAVDMEEAFLAGAPNGRQPSDKPGNPDPGPKGQPDKPGNPDPGPKAPPDKPGNPDPGPKAPPDKPANPVPVSRPPTQPAQAMVTDLTFKQAQPGGSLAFGLTQRPPVSLGDQNEGQITFAYDLPITDNVAVEHTYDQAAVRAFAGDRFRMPAMPPGASFTLASHFDKAGNLVQITVTEPTQGFRAVRHVAGGFAMTITFGSAHQVELKESPLAGWPSWLVHATQASGKVINFLWVQDGEWTYQFQPPHGDTARLLQWAQGLQ